MTSAEVSASDLDAMAKIEHESWMQHLQDNLGRRYGAERDDRRTGSPVAASWESAATPADQEKTREGVANALRILNRLGYR